MQGPKDKGGRGTLIYTDRKPGAEVRLFAKGTGDRFWVTKLFWILTEAVVMRAYAFVRTH